MLPIKNSIFLNFKFDRTCWAWIHGNSYVTPIVYLYWLFVNYPNGLSWPISLCKIHQLLKNFLDWLPFIELRSYLQTVNVNNKRCDITITLKSSSTSTILFFCREYTPIFPLTTRLKCPCMVMFNGTNHHVRCKDPFTRCDNVCDNVNCFLVTSNGFYGNKWTRVVHTDPCVSNFCCVIYLNSKVVLNVVADAPCEWTFKRSHNKR